MSIAAFKPTRATGAGPMAESLTPTQPLLLICVKLHLDIAGGTSENFTVTINSESGAAYDTLLFSQDMETVTDILWIPEQPIPILNYDVLDFAYANTNNRTWGLEIITKRED
jgi:hypothetical protein